MYTVYFDFKLRKKISLKKIGITIRNATLKEKRYIINNINEIICIKDQILEFYNKNKELDETSFEFLLEIQKIEDKYIRHRILEAFGMLKAGFVFNETHKIEEIVNKLVIIETDNLIMDKNGIKDIKRFVSNILSLNNICESPLLNKYIILKNDYSLILSDNPLDKNNEYYFHELMISFIFNYSKVEYKSFKEIKTTNNFLKKLEVFINKLDSNGICKFVEIIDLLFCDYTMPQSAIISNVTIVESLIINEKEDIQKAFILKGGIILKKYLVKSSNDAVSSLLKYAYNIRSDIVHGNYDKILIDLNALNQRTKETKKFIAGIDSIVGKKNEAYIIALNIAAMLSRATVKYWIENTKDTEFMKLN